MPSSKKGIQGPRPNPLRITKDLQKAKKPSETPSRPPTIFYEHTPKVVHASPQEFMGVVQQLTGRSSTPDSGRGFFQSQDQTDGSDDAIGSVDDSMLLLTLGRHQNLEKAGSSISPSLQFSSPSVVQYIFQKP
jgi:MAP kinase substrate 1